MNELAKSIQKRTQRKIDQMFREPQSAPSQKSGKVVTCPFFHYVLGVHDGTIYCSLCGECVTMWDLVVGKVHSQYQRWKSIFISFFNAGSQARNDDFCLTNQKFPTRNLNCKQMAQRSRHNSDLFSGGSGTQCLILRAAALLTTLF